MTSAAKQTASEATRAEFPLVRFFEEHSDSLPVKLASHVGKLGDQPPLRLLSAAFILAGVAGHHRSLRAGIRMLLAHELATAAKKLIKDRVDRRRPRSARSARHGAPRRGNSKDKELSSFPSGHTAGATAVAQAFAREFPEQAMPARAAAAGIALAQIPRCAHYPTDVGAGAAIGLAAERLVSAVWTAVEKRTAADQKTGLPSTLPGGE